MNTGRIKKPLMKRNAAMGFALKQWNKIAPDYGLAQTQRKDTPRLKNIKRMIGAMEAVRMDWRDKDSWRAMFRKVGSNKAKLEAAHGSPSFRVTFDWAINLKNTSDVMELPIPEHEEAEEMVEA